MENTIDVKPGESRRVDHLCSNSIRKRCDALINCHLLPLVRCITVSSLKHAAEQQLTLPLQPII